MSVTNGERLVTKQDLADMYQGILPYLGGMPEVLANKFSKGDMYSTDEKMIGQWIDQKPVYQKTVPFTVSTVGSIFTIDSTLTRSYVDNIIEISGDYTQSDGNKQSMNRVPVSSFNGLVAFIDATGLVIGTTSSTSKGSGYVNIKYTKTTDSAISIGSDTDYSTEEKIVGTWIDGSPLYQKTVDCGNLTNASSVTDITIAHSISNFKSLVQAVGTSYSTGGNTYSTLPLNNPNGGTGVRIRVNNTNITLTVKGDYSGFTQTYVTLQYTKTTGT